MANREDNLERWVEERLASLDTPAGWQPDGVRAFPGIERFDRKMRKQRARRLVAVAVFAAVCAAALLLEAPKAYCAGNGCDTPKNTPAPAAPQRPTPRGSSALP